MLFSQRGVLNLAHNLHDVREGVRRVHANRLNGVDAEWLDAERGQGVLPDPQHVADVRYPIMGATLQRRGGIARHDAVAWGFARGADRLGVDLIQNCEVTGIDVEHGKAVGVQTTRRRDRAPRRSCCAAPATPRCWPRMVGVRLPVQTHPLQALVSELLEPVLNCVVMSNAVHVYVSQAHKGELVMGAGIDAYNSYAQRGSFHVIEHQIAAVLELFPISAACTCCAPGPAWSTWRRTPRRSSAPRRWTACSSIAAGAPGLQGHARRGLGAGAHPRARRAASAGRAVRPGALHQRRADRRARRRGGGALRCC